MARILKQKLGKDRVITDTERLSEWGGDKWFVTQTPNFVVLPQSSEEVAEALRLANRHGVPVTPRGAGYGYVGGCVPIQGGMVLATERLNSILEIDRRDFVAVVQPGVITWDLQRQAITKKLFYPPDPASLKNCSIGGNIATNAGGPRCLKYGVTRNYVLGLQVALMDGTLMKLGGRTHKNKTGFDLVGLFVGSEGLLGVVTEATLKLLPLPPSQAVVSAGFANVRTAAKAVQAIFSAGHLPSAVELADAFTLNAARRSGKVKGIPRGDAYVLVEVDGQVASVRSEMRAIAKLLRTWGAQDISAASTLAKCNALWDLRRSFSFALRDSGLTKLNEDVVVPRGRLIDLIELAGRFQKSSGFPIACFGHAGDGNIHVNIMAADFDQPVVSVRVRKLLDELFEQILVWGGSITGEHGIGLAKLPWWNRAMAPELRTLHRHIKNAIDPKHLLNPGKFVLE
ncbi:MAG: FAD/FMN-containing dehydrogenase [Verrucomicrobia bacterium]|nr:MAG: FAD/FMN-containing dehydrogenase [Verrucomicrobiota bacterium]